MKTIPKPYHPKIKASAVIHCGKVYTWLRHCNAIEKAVDETGVMPVKGCQWFILDDEHETFVDRQVGMIHAKNSWQVDKNKKSEHLFSEDLW